MGGSIYLIVNFNFPKPFKPEYGELVSILHQLLDADDWIEDVLTASGGIGGGPPSIWVFKLMDYASLDRLFRGGEAILKAYFEFFRVMDDVEDIIREEVIFSS